MFGTQHLLLFITSGLFALATLALSWKACRGELRAIRRQLAGLEDQRAFTVRLALTETHEFTPPLRRAAIKPKAAYRQQARPALRAAA